MNFTRIQNHSCCCRPLISQFYKLPSLLHHFPETLRFPAPQRFSLITSPTHFPLPSISRINASVVDLQQEDGGNDEMDYLAPDGPVYRNTLRLVECSMFAAVTGLVYFLSNSLSIENYFGWFFPLPIVISSLRWGVAAGRKTMVATAMLLFVLSGPVKALTYLVASKLDSFHFLVHDSSSNWSDWLCPNIVILNKGEHTCSDYSKHPRFTELRVRCNRHQHHSVDEFHIHTVWHSCGDK
ncbi:hypothetical protein LINGRAHAP2_LOCUS37315 [Linum grandiflorum]